MKPKLSVRLMTFNHGKYIEQALKGAISQVTDFPFEIVIGDDFSNDNTKEIIEHYRENFPSKVKVLERKEGDEYHRNRKKYGRLYNFKNILENCKGDYIALLDGDDYWTDDHKLQKQVDFLNANPEFALSCHQAYYLNESTGDFRYPIQKKHQGSFEVYTIDDLLNGNFITTCTVVFRNSIKLPDWFTSLPVADWPLYLMICGGTKGNIQFSNEYMAVYRINESGVFSQSTRENQTMRLIETCSILEKNATFFETYQWKLLKQLNTNYHLQYLSQLHNVSSSRNVRFRWLLECLPYLRYCSVRQLKYLSLFLFDTITGRK